MSASTRSYWWTPTDAPTRSLPRKSRHARGCRRVLSMSRIVTKPVNLPASSISGNFSTRARIMIASASARGVFNRPVARFLLVIESPTVVVPAIFETNFISRRVRIPTNLPPRVPSSVTGNPLTPCSNIKASARATDSCGLKMIGSTMIPFSLRLTLATSLAC